MSGGGPNVSNWAAANWTAAAEACYLRFMDRAGTPHGEGALRLYVAVIDHCRWLRCEQP